MDKKAIYCVGFGLLGVFLFNHSQKSHSANDQPWNVLFSQGNFNRNPKKIQNTTPPTTINLQVELFSTTNLPGYTVPWTLGNSSNLQRCVVSREDSRIGHATAGPPKKDGQNLWLF